MKREQIIRLCQGNPGALRVLMELDAAGHTELIDTIERAGVKGPGIWILFKDRCGESIGTLADLLIRPPANLLALSEDRPRG